MKITKIKPSIGFTAYGLQAWYRDENGKAHECRIDHITLNAFMRSKKLLIVKKIKHEWLLLPTKKNITYYRNREFKEKLKETFEGKKERRIPNNGFYSSTSTGM